MREYCRQGTDERLGDLPARFNEEPLIVKDFLVVHAFVVHAEAVHCSWEICRTCSSVCHYARLLLSVFFMSCICIRDTSIASFFCVLSLGCSGLIVSTVARPEQSYSPLSRFRVRAVSVFYLKPR